MRSMLTNMSNSGPQLSAASSLGATPTERYLDALCQRTFLKLWRWPRVFRNQRAHRKTEGKEICDLLVVFDSFVLVFSDKSCRFPDTGNLDVDWSRWFRSAVLKSADQLAGGIRWLEDHPSRVFVDQDCREPLPISLPQPDQATIIPIAVAHGSAGRCRAAHGGSGGLLVRSEPASSIESPFVVGNLVRRGRLVHVFDERSVELVLQQVDTISDFTHYLRARAELLLGRGPSIEAREEDLLARYTKTMAGDKHGFSSEQATELAVEPGLWDSTRLDD